ncbi:MAG: response regulator [Candidatus Wallbacteria bacterium]|nr:response regulator [Candidatus Wallbacteria bacterium]
MSAGPIRVLIADDFPTALEGLRRIVESTPEFHVIAALTEPRRVLEAVEREKPDLILLDFDMPELDGAQLTQAIMARFPTPVLIVSGLDSPATRQHAQFRALEAGAIDMVGKSMLAGADEDGPARRAFLRKLRVAAGVTVFRRWRGVGVPASPRPRGKIPGAQALRVISESSRGCRVVAIAASTGGPPALSQVLSSFGGDFPVPVVVVQHIGDEFLDGFVGWLGTSSGRKTLKAQSGQWLEAGTVYVAPEDCHLEVTPNLTVTLDRGVELNGCRPSADRLFGSVATAIGAAAIGVLLTGMGRDGATGLKLMRQSGAVTLVQDEDTSVVYGMPGEAVKLSAQTAILPLTEIGPALRAILLGKERDP